MKKEDRLREIIDFLKNKYSLTNSGLSLALGYSSETYVSDVLGKKGATPQFIRRLERIYRVNPGYIESGNLPKMLENSSSTGNAEGELMILLKEAIQANKEHALANRDNAEANKKNADSISRLVGIVEMFSSRTFDEASEPSSKKDKASRRRGIEDLPDKSETRSGKSQGQQRGTVRH